MNLIKYCAIATTYFYFHILLCVHIQLIIYQKTFYNTLKSLDYASPPLLHGQTWGGGLFARS
jgi:hypothetical protein